LRKPEIEVKCKFGLHLLKPKQVWSRFNPCTNPDLFW